MAKRKRLTPANPMFLDPAPETKSESFVLTSICTSMTTPSH